MKKLLIAIMATIAFAGCATAPPAPPMDIQYQSGGQKVEAKGEDNPCAPAPGRHAVFDLVTGDKHVEMHGENFYKPQESAWDSKVSD